MNSNNLLDCDLIGAISPKNMVSILETLYDKAPESIASFIETAPGMMGQVVEEMFIASSNKVNYGLI